MRGRNLFFTAALLCLFGVFEPGLYANPVPILANQDFPGGIIPGAETPVVVEKEELDIHFHSGPQYASFDHGAITPRADVSARYHLFNPSDSATAIDIAFPVLEGKWENKTKIMYNGLGGRKGTRFSEEIMEKYLPRKFSIRYKGENISVTRESIDLSIKSWIKPVEKKWHKEITDLLAADAELASTMSKMRETSEFHDNFRELKEQIKAEAEKTLGEDVPLEKLLIVLGCMQKGWGSTCDEHAAVAMLMPYADPRFRLDHPEDNTSRLPYLVNRYWDSENTWELGRHYCYCSFFEEWRAIVEGWLGENATEELKRLAAACNRFSTHEVTREEIDRAMEILLEEFAIPPESIMDMVYFLEDETQFPIETATFLSPSIREEYKEIKGRRDSYAQKWHVPESFISPFTGELYPIGTNATEPFPNHGLAHGFSRLSKYYRGSRKSIWRSFLERDFSFCLHLYKFSIVVASKEKGLLEVSYSSTMADDPVFSDEQWAMPLCQFQYIIKTGSYWPSFGGVSIKLTFPKNSVPTIFPEATPKPELGDRDQEVYSIYMPRPSENLYVNMAGRKKNPHSQVQYIYSYNLSPEANALIKKHFENMPMAQRPLALQIATYSWWRERSGDRVSPKAMEIINTFWQKTEIQKLLDFPGHFAFDSNIKELIDGYFCKFSTIMPNEAALLRYKLFPDASRLSGQEKLYSFLLKVKSEPWARHDTSEFIELSANNELLDDAITVAGIILVQPRNRISGNNWEFDTAPVIDFLVEKMRHPEASIRNKAYRAYCSQNIGLEYIEEMLYLLGLNTDREIADKAIDHLAENNHYYNIEDYAESIIGLLRQKNYDLKSPSCFPLVALARRPYLYDAYLQVATDTNAAAKSRSEAFAVLGHFQKPFFSKIPDPDDLGIEAKTALALALKAYDTDALEFLRSCLQHPGINGPFIIENIARNISTFKNAADAEMIRNKVFLSSRGSPDFWRHSERTAQIIGSLLFPADIIMHPEMERESGFIKLPRDKNNLRGILFNGGYKSADGKILPELERRIPDILKVVVYDCEKDGWVISHPYTEILSLLDDEWVDTLLALADDSDTLEQIGLARLVSCFAAGRTKILDEYTRSTSKMVRRVSLMALDYNGKHKPN